MGSANSPEDLAGSTAEGVGDFLDKDFFESLVENGSDAIVSIDENSRILFANDAVERVFGYPPADLVGEDLTVIMPERFEAAHHESIADYLRTGEKNLDWSDIQLPAKHAEGHEIQLDITFEEHRYEGRRVFSGIMRDITERVAREKRLERQRDQLERFASIVSHDLRDPLQSAKSCAAIARAQADSDGDDVLSDLEASLDRMDELIEDVLTLAKQGRTVGEMESVSLLEAAERAWETTDTGDATLAVENPPEAVCADEERLRTLLQNLFRNAVEHNDRPVTVTVSGLSDGTGFVVADDGTGFDIDDTEQLFDYGYTSTESGTGFGLSIVADVAAALGWEVAAGESESGGARFVFSGVRPGTERDRT